MDKHTRLFVGVFTSLMFIIMVLAVSRLMRYALFMFVFSLVVMTIWGYFLTTEEADKELRFTPANKLPKPGSSSTMRETYRNIQNYRRKIAQLQTELSLSYTNAAKLIRKAFAKPKALGAISDEQLISQFGKIALQHEALSEQLLDDCKQLVQSQESRADYLSSETEFWQILEQRQTSSYIQLHEAETRLKQLQKESELQKKRIQKAQKVSAEMRAYLNSQQSQSESLSNSIEAELNDNENLIAIRTQIAQLQQQQEEATRQMAFQTETYNLYHELQKQYNSPKQSSYPMRTAEIRSLIDKLHHTQSE